MSANTKTIKGRIKSIKNTKKITKAMELVAASKMRKAVSAVLASRPFSTLSWETVSAIGAVTDELLHPLLRRPATETGRTLLVLLTSDRGLAGGFNSNMIRAAKQRISELGDVKTICIGKRGTGAMNRLEVPVIASFSEMANHPTFADVKPIAKLVMDEYATEAYDRVLIGYTDFINSISQKPKMLTLLPLGSEKDLQSIGDVGQEEKEEASDEREYTFEPSTTDVLDRVLPKIIETTLYQAVLESAASEHSARMLAMRNASDSANDMIDELTLSFNQARQAAITQEIAEISSGKAALEN